MVSQPFQEKPFTPPASPLTPPASVSPSTPAIIPISPFPAIFPTVPDKDLMSLKIERLHTASWRLTYTPPTDVDSQAQSIILHIDPHLQAPPPPLDPDKIAADLAALQELHKAEHFTLPNDDPDDESYLNPSLRLKPLQKPPPEPLQIDLLTPNHMDHILSFLSNGHILTPEPDGILSTEPIIKLLQSRDDFHLTHLLQPLHHHTPYMRFFNSAQAKIEIEQLTDTSYGIKLSHQAAVSSSSGGGVVWNTMCILLAPYGLDIAAAKPWCQTLGTNGLKRAEGFDWGILERVEHVFASKGGKRGVLDVVVMPAVAVAEGQKRGGSFLGLGGRSSKLLSQSQFPLGGEAQVYTWVVPKEGVGITRQSTLEGMLRANGVSVYGDFERDGVKVVEVEEGGNYVARAVPRGMVRNSSLDSMTRDDSFGSLSMISRVTSLAGLRENE